MTRSFFLAILLSLSIAGLVLSFSGTAEINNKESFSESSSRVLQSPEGRALLVDRITAEVWKNVDVQGEIEKLLPSDAAILSGPAETAARGAFSTAVNEILQQGFIENIWGPGLQKSRDATLLPSEKEDSALLITKEKAYLDISKVLKTAASNLGLPPVIENNIPSLGNVPLAKRQSVAEVQTSYNVLKVSPLLLLPLVVLLLASLLASEQRTLWRGGILLGGSLLLSGVLLLFLQATLPAYFTSSSTDPFSLALAEYIWENWSAEIIISAKSLLLLSVPIILLSLLLSPRALSNWQKLIDSAIKEEAEKPAEEKLATKPSKRKQRKQTSAPPKKSSSGKATPYKKSPPSGTPSKKTSSKKAISTASSRKTSSRKAPSAAPKKSPSRKAPSAAPKKSPSKKTKSSQSTKTTSTKAATKKTSLRKTSPSSTKKKT